MSSILSRLVRTITFPFRFILGFDAFISYAREDTEYAEALHIELDRKIRPRIDLQESGPGERIPFLLRLALVRSKVLVLLCTLKSAQSIHVQEEVETFLNWNGGPIILVEVSAQVESAIWWPTVRGLARIKRPDIEDADLSHVVRRVVNSVGYWKISRRQAVISLCFCLLLASFAYLSHQTELLARAAEQKRQQAQAEADKQIKIAKTQRALAEQRKLEAERSAGEKTRADQLAQAARAAESASIRGRERAERETRIVSAWQRAALQATRDSPLHIDDDRSALLAVNALQLHSLTPLYPHFVVEEALQSSLTLSATAHVLDDQGSCRLLALSPEDRYVAAGCDGALRVWNLESPSKPVASKEFQNSTVRCITFRPRATYQLAFVDSSGVAGLFDITLRKVIYTFGHNEASSCSFSPDGNHIAIANSRGNVELWALSENKDPELRSEISGHGAPGETVLYIPNKHEVLSCGSLLDLRRWDVSDASHPKRLPDLISPRPIKEFAIDGTRVFALGIGSKVWSWDLVDARPERKDIYQGPKDLSAFSIMPAGRLAIATNTGSVQLVNPTRSGQVETALNGQNSAVVFVKAFAQGRRIATLNSNHAVRIWDLNPPSTKDNILVGGSQYSSISFTTGVSEIVSTSSEKLFTRWRLNQAQPVKSIPKPPQSAKCGHIAPGGSLVLCEASARVDVFSSEGTGEHLAELPIDPRRITSTAFSFDGKSVAVAEVGMVRVCNISRTPTCRTYIAGGRPVRDVAFSTDGKHLFASDDAVRIWDLSAPGPAILRIQSKQDSFGKKVTFSPVGDRFAVNGDQAVHVYKVVRPISSTGTILWISRECSVPELYAQAIAFSFTDDLVATTSGDRQIHVWDLRQPTAPPVVLTSQSGYQRAVSVFETSLAFAPDNTHLAAANFDSTIEVWPIWTGAARFLCKFRIWRSLSASESRSFIGGQELQRDSCSLF